MEKRAALLRTHTKYPWLRFTLDQPDYVLRDFAAREPARRPEPRRGRGALFGKLLGNPDLPGFERSATWPFDFERAVFDDAYRGRLWDACRNPKVAFNYHSNWKHAAVAELRRVVVARKEIEAGLISADLEDNYDENELFH